jgi:transposase
MTERSGAQLAYLPPYSPDYNPIEQAYSKLKCNAAERTTEDLWQLLGRLINRYAPTECQNYISHCGYGVILLRKKRHFSLIPTGTMTTGNNDLRKLAALGTMKCGAAIFWRRACEHCSHDRPPP